MPNLFNRASGYWSRKRRPLRLSSKASKFRWNIPLYVVSSLALIYLGNRQYVNQACEALMEAWGLYTPSCQGSGSQAAEAGHSSIYAPILHWISKPTRKDVAVLYIDDSLSELQLNTCLARSYLADVLHVVAAQHPARIVIDKYFGLSTCPDGDNLAFSNRLVREIQSLDFPVIVGRSTQVSTEAKFQPCLVQQPELHFYSANVIYGLLRPNADLVKIPLQWSVSRTASERPEPQDSLALATLNSFAPEISQDRRFTRLLESHRQPYAYIDKAKDDLPTQSSNDLLCSRADESITDRWQLKCEPASNLSVQGRLSLFKDKVVLIGARSENDREYVLGNSYWGYELQARYLDDLLTGTYLLAAPWSIPLAIYIFFVLVSEAPRFFKRESLEAFTERHQFHLGWARDHLKLIWSATWAIVLIFGASFVFLLLHWLPPLELIGLIAFSFAGQCIAELQTMAIDHYHSTRT